MRGAFAGKLYHYLSIDLAESQSSLFSATEIRRNSQLLTGLYCKWSFGVKICCRIAEETKSMV
jgi:hypothetical protein